MKEGNIFKQIESMGLNKEEILWIYEHTEKYVEFLQKEIKRAEQLNDLTKKLKDIQGGFTAVNESGDDITNKLDGIFEKQEEALNKTKIDFLVVNSVKNKLKPLKEIFE